MKRWRQVAIFAGEHPRIVIWRGLQVQGRTYRLTRERTHRIGRLLDGGTTVGRINGELIYRWNDWNWGQIAKGGK